MDVYSVIGHNCGATVYRFRQCWIVGDWVWRAVLPHTAFEMWQQLLFADAPIVQLTARSARARLCCSRQKHPEHTCLLHSGDANKTCSNSHTHMKNTVIHRHTHTHTLAPSTHIHKDTWTRTQTHFVFSLLPMCTLKCQYFTRLLAGLCKCLSRSRCVLFLCVGPLIHSPIKKSQLHPTTQPVEQRPADPFKWRKGRK